MNWGRRVVRMLAGAGVAVSLLAGAAAVGQEPEGERALCLASSNPDKCSMPPVIVRVPPAEAEAPAANVRAPADPPAPPVLMRRAPETPSRQAAAPAVPQVKPRPAIWVIEDEDTRIYLFGTVHVVSRDLLWRSPALDRVMAESDELILEVPDVQDIDESLAQAAMMGEKPRPILGRVSPAYRERLRAAIERTGLPIGDFDQLNGFAASALLMVSPEELERAMTQPAARQISVERTLAADFTRRGRPVSGFETQQAQANLLRHMSRATERELLEAVLDGRIEPEMAGIADELSWAQGDISKWVRWFEAFPTEMYDIMLTRRNEDWAAQIAERMERPGTVLVAVGAGHLEGRTSVQTFLRARGISSRRHD